MHRLRNLGPKSGRWLEAVGISTYAELERLGAVEAYRRVLASGQRPNLNLLWALQGAILDLPWTALPREMKAQLEQELAHSDSESG